MLEALVGIVCDVNASAEVRRKVAVKLAIYFLPHGLRRVRGYSIACGRKRGGRNRSLEERGVATSALTEVD